MLLSAALVFSVQPYIGLGNGELDWSIASDVSGAVEPNVLSELQFKDLDTREAGLKLHLGTDLFWNGFEVFLEADVSAGSIESGTVTDADYDRDNRTGLWSLSESQVEGDDIDNTFGAVGVSYKFPRSKRPKNKRPRNVSPENKSAGKHKISALLGGYYSEQVINFQRGVQLVAEPPHITTSIDRVTEHLQNNLDSDYSTEWEGAWLGAEYQFSWQRWSAQVRASYLAGTYYGEGRWNLRATGRNPLKQPRSFSHEADSTGIQWQVGMGYQLTEHFALHLNWQYNDWETDSGSAVTYFADDTIGRARFNGAQWESSTWQLGASYRFSTGSD